MVQTNSARERVGCAAVSVGTFISTLVSGMVRVALPSMTHSLSTDVVTVAGRAPSFG